MTGYDKTNRTVPQTETNHPLRMCVYVVFFFQLHSPLRNFQASIILRRLFSVFKSGSVSY